MNGWIDESILEESERDKERKSNDGQKKKTMAILSMIFDLLMVH